MLPVYRQRRPICIDAGTQFCPCSLADSGECLTCSMLRGEDLCNCDWRGVCIYSEYRFNGQHSRNPRQEQTVSVLEQTHLSANVVKLTVEAPRGFDADWCQPGAFIMARATETTPYYSVPLCVYRAVAEQPSQIELVVQENGVKTKALLSNPSTLDIRGPFFNGWFGYRAVKVTYDSQVIMVVRGMGQAPSLRMAEHLLSGNNELLVYLDPGSTQVAFIHEELERMGAHVKRVNLLDDSVYQEIAQILREQAIGLVVSAGADIQHVRLADLIKMTGSTALLTLLNNHSMTCGEGICGSCMIEVAKGEKVKTCKSQLLGEQIVKTINTHLYNE